MAHVWVYLSLRQQRATVQSWRTILRDQHANYIILTAKETDQLPMKWYPLYIPIIETLHPFFSSKILNDIPEEQQTVQLTYIVWFWFDKFVRSNIESLVCLLPVGILTMFRRFICFLRFSPVQWHTCEVAKLI